MRRFTINKPSTKPGKGVIVIGNQVLYKGATYTVKQRDSKTADIQSGDVVLKGIKLRRLEKVV